MTASDWAFLWNHDNSISTNRKYKKNGLKLGLELKDVWIQGYISVGWIEPTPTNIPKWEWVCTIILLSKRKKFTMVNLINFLFSSG